MRKTAAKKPRRPARMRHSLALVLFFVSFCQMGTVTLAATVYEPAVSALAAKEPAAFAGAVPHTPGAYAQSSEDALASLPDFFASIHEQDPFIFWGTVVLFVLLVGGILWYFLYVRFAAKNYKSMLARRSAGKARDFKNTAYCRELPFGDSLPAAFSALNLVKDLPNQSTIVGAILLDWIRLEKVLLQNSPDGLCIHLYENAPELSPQETALYNIFLQASGADHILQPGEFKRWGQKNPGQVTNWLASYDELGLYLLHDIKVVETREAYKYGVAARVAEQNARVLPPPPPPGSGLPSHPKNFATNVYFTRAGRAALAQTYGFRKYLKDFTIIEERLPQEVQLWQRYLVYAQLFGNAVAVSKSFAKTYPASFAGDTSSSRFLQAILSGLTDALDKAWFEVLTAGAKGDALGTRK